MIQDYIRLAFLNLSTRRLRSWLTMIGIFIGIAAVVSLIGLGEGLSTAIRSQFGFLGSDMLAVQASGISYAGPPGTGAVTPLSDTLVDKIRRIPGVKAAFNRDIRSAEMVFNDNQQFAYIASVPTGSNRKVFDTMLNLKTIDGRLLRDGDTTSVVLGNSFSDSGIFGKVIKAGDVVRINNEAFHVVGILARKGTFTIDHAVLMNQDEFNKVFNNPGTADIIAIQVKNPDQIEQVKQDVEKLLRKERDVKKGEENFQVQTPQSIVDTLNSTLFAVQLFVYIIAGISIVVGGIGIMNTMYTSVLERTRSIGIMKAIGARNSVVFTLFFLESGFLGLVGGIIGVALGLSLAYGLAYVGRIALGARLIQATISPILVFGSLIFSFGLGTLFGVLPAIQASRMQPVEALRK